MPQRQIDSMQGNGTCSPAVECLIHDAYEVGSILEESKKVPYSSYYTLRIIAEIFPILIHMLLNISIIIATRETSVGRGNIGHQWAFYPIGILLFATVLGLVNHPVEVEQFYIPIITFCVTMFVCAIVVLLSG